MGKLILVICERKVYTFNYVEGRIIMYFILHEGEGDTCYCAKDYEGEVDTLRKGKVKLVSPRREG